MRRGITSSNNSGPEGIHPRVLLKMNSVTSTTVASTMPMRVFRRHPANRAGRPIEDIYTLSTVRQTKSNHIHQAAPYAGMGMSHPLRIGDTTMSKVSVMTCTFPSSTGCGEEIIALRQATLDEVVLNLNSWSPLV